MSAPPVHKLDSTIGKTERKADQAKVSTENAAERAEQKIDVDTVGGHGSLAGIASDAASPTRATESAQTVKGVVSVDSKFEVR